MHSARKHARVDRREHNLSQDGTLAPNPVSLTLSWPLTPVRLCPSLLRFQAPWQVSAAGQPAAWTPLGAGEEEGEGEVDSDGEEGTGVKAREGREGRVGGEGGRGGR